MWVLSWKKYSLSKFATFLSVIGAMLRYAGVACLVSSLIPAGIICLAIGIAVHFGAESIAKNKTAKVIAKTNSAKNVTPTAATTRPVNPAPAPTVTQKQKKCIRCGAILNSESKFCHECGYEVK